MNFKGYVQVSPTEKQIESLKEYVKVADDFVTDFDAQEALLGTCNKEWWFPLVRRYNELKVSFKCPYTVEYFYDLDHYFVYNPDYYIMKAILDMYNAGDPLYLDNEMCRVWNMVKGKG